MNELGLHWDIVIFTVTTLIGIIWFFKGSKQEFMDVHGRMFRKVVENGEKADTGINRISKEVSLIEERLNQHIADQQRDSEWIREIARLAEKGLDRQSDHREALTEIKKILEERK